MTSEILKDRIHQYCQSLNIADVGFSSAEPFFGLEADYTTRIENGLGCELELRHSVEELMNPKLIMPTVSSILTIVEPHKPYNHKSVTSKEKPYLSLKGKMATGTASTDYHLIVTEKLIKLGEILKKQHHIESTVISDTSPLSDRALAVRAGLGVLRRNNMFYHNSMGSYVHIGSLLIDYPLETVDHKKDLLPCGHCKICKIVCPSGAIIGDGTIDSNRCVSYLTQKKEVSMEESEVMGTMIYGCDVCQHSCPINKMVFNTEIPLIVNPEVDLVELLALDNKTFKETYGQTAAGWRGKRTLQRNAIIALGQFKNPKALEVLKYYENDPRPIIKNEVERSIKKLKALGVD